MVRLAMCGEIQKRAAMRFDLDVTQDSVPCIASEPKLNAVIKPPRRTECRAHKPVANAPLTERYGDLEVAC